MTGRRPHQVADLIRHELASLIQQDLRDPGVGFVTVTGVRMSPDLGTARVYISVLGDSTREAEALEALRRAAGYLRRRLSGRVYLKKMPELTFHSDASIKQGARIETILSDLRDEDAGSEEEE